MTSSIYFWEYLLDKGFSNYFSVVAKIWTPHWAKLSEFRCLCLGYRRSLLEGFTDVFQIAHLLDYLILIHFKLQRKILRILVNT